MNGQEELREQCEAYVLGLLEGEERSRIEALLQRQDPACTAAMRDAEEMVATLAYAAPQQEPPALLRARLLNEVRAATPVAAARGRWWVAATGWAAAAACVIFLVIGQTNEDVLRRDLEAARIELNRLAEEANQNRRVIDVLKSRNTQMIRLTATGANAPQFLAYWSEPAGLVLAGSNVPVPAAGRALQLWVVPKSGNPVSAGVFEPDQNGQVLLVAPSVEVTQAAAAVLAITDEPAGGSPQPTTTPAWTGAVGD